MRTVISPMGRGRRFAYSPVLAFRTCSGCLGRIPYRVRRGDLPGEATCRTPATGTGTAGGRSAEGCWLKRPTAHCAVSLSTRPWGSYRGGMDRDAPGAVPDAYPTPSGVSSTRISQSHEVDHPPTGATSHSCTATATDGRASARSPKLERCCCAATQLRQEHCQRHALHQRPSSPRPVGDPDPEEGGG